MGISPKHEQLAAMSDDEIISRYDAQAEHTVVGTAFYREELVRRQLARESARMMGLTKTMARLTWAIFALTAINTAAVVYPLFKA